MKDGEYVQPPSYNDSYSDSPIQKSENNSLISKLRVRIEKDLNQINGVYNNQITEAEKQKQKRLIVM